MPTVLIVDDEIAILQFYRSILKPEGYTVVTAMSVEEGYRLCQEVRPHLLIVDFCLPDGDGIDLLEKSLALEYPPAAVLTSGAVTPGIASVATQLGATVLEKPSGVARILDLVRKAVGPGKR